MSRHLRHLFLLSAVLLLVLAAFGGVSQNEPSAFPGGACVAVGRAATISPDYRDVVIPPNIAPLNFQIREAGSRYYVRIRSEKGRSIEISSRSGEIRIPERPWRTLLEMNRGRELHVDVFVLPDRAADDPRQVRPAWRRFESFSNTVAVDNIDRYLVYRRIHPAHSTWREMGIYQRDLSTFDESVVLHNRNIAGGCLNCHTLCANRSDTMLISSRSSKYGSAALLNEDGRIRKVGTKFGYTSWHPSGKLITYSVNKVALFLHSANREVRDVIDLDSLLAYYVLDARQIRTAEPLARKDRLETYPTWSPDGRYLYFCSAPLTWKERNIIPASYDEIHYDLVRIAYDLDRDQWGRPETVLDAKQTGKSILLPRVSPDGRWLLFCTCDYGCFPVYQKSSDLHILDLQSAADTGNKPYRRLGINSDESESWHSWSSNSRWIAFSSKRGTGLFTRTYLSYIDENGRACKPILLPQKTPSHYDGCLWTYSVPELVSAPVRATGEKLARVLRDPEAIEVAMPITMATPRATPSSTPEESYPIAHQ
ncbi:MAG: PD40 domain-containing protein [Sedimentisphaerales bacterium]|nr:PD40 domain-containing protein [Sedimentisphaerales bacterium]